MYVYLKEDDDLMDVKSSINPRTIIVNSSSKSKDEVLKEIIHSMHNAGNVSSEEGFLKSVYQRESQGITGIGNGVAIPHGQSESVVEPGVAIATLKDPIPWESLDDQKTKIVVLFAVPDNSEGAKLHLQLLAQFARKLGDDDVLASLKSAKNVQEITAAFEN
ncbi:phosphoenolpyruvate-dependent sugar phosphotransferase system, EIIA 2 [Lentilactobacillus kisonensis DSM 19906 = JCM 15041]|uniref:Phosphoenolpyruvate-dependent sugar phosphotransferase system, EIIA 2 n=2 Tax=Lentilactobacillus kisonensis TaxID=481722 RepID=A0A0R1NQB2_9LACO|nr:phosphoenolpyruvate-dependent sugar phosphotransferase system, EIIA 2 [Lentilactobacillus kisonensis DSM 19906 = JCM 15041]